MGDNEEDSFCFVDMEKEEESYFSVAMEPEDTEQESYFSVAMEDSEQESSDRDATPELDSTISSDSIPTNGQTGGSVQVEPTTISLDTATLNLIISGQSDHKTLGSGAYGRVYRYTCPVTGKIVALKHLISLKLRKCQPMAEKFQREMTVHRNLDHKNIVKFINSIRNDDVGTEGVVVLVVEYAERGSLHDLMRKGELERSKILRHTAQILKGLHYLHTCVDIQGLRRPIVHRDLRCANVLMARDGTVKIADFGLCKILYDMAAASGIKSKEGNPFWYAPELVNRSARRDKSVHQMVLMDVWSLGVLIMELYYYGAARIPYINHYKEQHYIIKLGNGWVPRTPRAAPKEIKQLLDKCFEYSVENRPSAEKLLAMMDNFNLTRLGHLDIAEPIKPTLVESSSSSGNTPDSFNTLTDGFRSDTDILVETPQSSEIDPLDDEDSLYLTLKLDWKLEHRDRLLNEATIRRFEGAIELAPYVSKGIEEFVLEDRYDRDSTYLVTRKESEEDVFRVTFDEGGKLLTVKHRQTKLFSIDAGNDVDGFLSTTSAGGIAQLNMTGGIEKKFTKNRLKLESVTTEGAKLLDAMSPTMSRTRTAAASSPTPSSLRSQQAVLNIQYDNWSLAVIKNKQPHKYEYEIRYREDKVVIASFSTSVTEGKCEISVQPDTNNALVATVVAFYYKFKCKNNKKSMLEIMLETVRHVINPWNWVLSRTYGQLSDS